MAHKQKSRICREGYYYLIVLGFVITGAILREINLLLVLAGMMAGPFLLDWRLGIEAMFGLTARRRLPERIGAGDLFVVDVLLNKQRLGASVFQLASRAVVVEDTIEHEQAVGSRNRTQARISQARAVAWQIRCGEQVRVSYRGRFERRGRYHFGPLRLSTRFPIGLVRRTLIDETAQQVVVLPRLGRMGDAWRRLYQDAIGGSQRRLAQQTAREGEFHGLRDWQHGDVRRWIHWRTTARRGVPVVRQFERHLNQEFALLVDLAPSSGTPSSRMVNDVDDVVEETVSCAATIVSDVCRRAEGAFTVSVGGATPETIQGAASMGLSRRILDALAVAQPPIVDIDDRGDTGQGAGSDARSSGGLADLLEQGLQGVRPGTPVILLTSRPQALADRESFAHRRNDPRLAELIARMQVIDVQGEHFAEYFLSASQSEALAAPAGTGVSAGHLAEMSGQVAPAEAASEVR